MSPSPVGQLCPETLTTEWLICEVASKGEGMQPEL